MKILIKDDILFVIFLLLLNNVGSICVSNKNMSRVRGHLHKTAIPPAIPVPKGGLFKPKRDKAHE